MIARTGWKALTAALAGLILAVGTLDYLILLAALAAFTFLAADILGFHVAVPGIAPSQFTAERSPVRPRLPLGSEVDVEVTVTYHGARGFWGELFDTLPAGVEILAGRPSLSTWWTPGTSTTLSYRLRVVERGAHLLGPTVVLAEAPLALAFEQAVLPTTTELLGVPSESGRRTGLPGARLLNTVHGNQELRRRGFGSEFRGLRPYQGEDDVRSIAWRRSTLDELLVREFTLEARQDYLLIFDVSRGMSIGPPGGTALDRAVEAGWVLASRVASAGEDRIALLARAGDWVDFLPAGRGHTHLAKVQERLARWEVHDGAFDLGTTLLDLLPRLRTHTHVFVFSSLDAPLDKVGVAHRRFVGKGHRLTLLTPEAARLYPAGWLTGRAESERWARRLESGRLQRRLEALRAVGIPAVRYDARTATNRLLASYGQMRAWGRGS